MWCIQNIPKTKCPSAQNTEKKKRLLCLIMIKRDSKKDAGIKKKKTKEILLRNTNGGEPS